MSKINELSSFTRTLRLLLVEDEQLVREQMSELLQYFFYDVTTAFNGKDGLEKYQKENFDLIITDITMPQMDGIEMVQEIRKANKHIPIIFISQHNESNILLECINLYINGYVLKPVIYEDLLNAIDKALVKIKFEFQKKDYELYLEQYLTLINQSNIISKTDINGKITYVNESFCKITGYSKEELIGENHRILRHPDNPKEIYENMWKTIKTKKQKWEGVVKNFRKDAIAYYSKTLITPILNQNNEIVEFIATRDSIDTIIDDKSHLLEKIQQNDISILALVQIDEFEMLEKFYNIATVYQIEKNFIYNLEKYFPYNFSFENIYSLGNGRFALLCSSNKFETLQIPIIEYLKKFIKNVSEGFLHYDEMEFDINITLSYAIGKFMIYEDAQAGLEYALENKLELVYGNDFSIQASKEAHNNLQVIKDIKDALDNYRIVSYFQPIVNNQTQQIEKYESLVRLINSQNKVVSPNEFLNISKQGRYYNKITHRVFENSFKILDKIKTKLSINLCAEDIEKELTRHYIFDLLDKYKESNQRIIFEIVEDGLEDIEIVVDFITKVKKRGVVIAIDDFGAGHSNFERILKLQPDILKIDGSLIKNIQTDVYSKSIVETIVNFAKKQNIQTIAEYVENEAIFDILKEIGVDYSQGYFFGKPTELT